MRGELRTKPSIEDGITYHERFSPYERGAPTQEAVTEIVEYQPGNGTRYRLILLHSFMWNDDVLKFMGYVRGTVIVTLATDPSRMRSVTLAPSGIIHWKRMERIVEGVADQVVLAELLGHLLDRPHVTCEEFLREYAEVTPTDSEV